MSKLFKFAAVRGVASGGIVLHSRLTRPLWGRLIGRIVGTAA